MFYASKYLAKKTQEHVLLGVGRFWGVLNREYLPFELLTVPMTFQQFYLLRRMVVRWGCGTKSAIAENAKRGRRLYKVRIRGEHSGLTLFKDYEQLLPLLRVLA